MRMICVALLLVVVGVTACGDDRLSAGGGADDDRLAAADPDEGCGEHTVRHSFIAAEGSTWDRAAGRWAGLVAEGSDERIDIRLYPGAQLADADQQEELEQVRSGDIDSLWVSPIILASFLDQRFDIYSLPFLFPDHETANEVIDGPVGDMTEEWVREGGLEPLGWGVNGFRQLTNSRQPVHEPADLRGLRVRVAGTDLFVETFRLMDAEPVTMNFAEVHASLERGVIDAQENPLSIIDSSSLDEVQDHLSLWNYSYDPLVLAMNADMFEQFCASDQELLRDAAREASRFFRQLAIQEDEELPAVLAERGLEVVPTDEVDVEAFRALVQDPIHDRWRPIIGERAVDMVLEAVEAAGDS